LAPQVDETALPDEAPTALASRLAVAKARAGAALHTRSDPGVPAWVIGSDQVIDFADQALGKPLTHGRAVEQLQAMRGAEFEVHTAIAVIRTRDGQLVKALDTVRVKLRNFTNDELQRYLELETPYDCAGAIKSEGLGGALIERIASNDPSSLIGLPLLSLQRLLAQLDYHVLDEAGRA
jgi:septum formation protein